MSAAIWLFADGVSPPRPHDSTVAAGTSARATTGRVRDDWDRRRTISSLMVLYTVSYRMLFYSVWRIIMLVKVVLLASLLVISATPAALAQDASSVVAAASKAMGTDNLNAIAYIGPARIGAFGQSKSIGDPMGAVNVTNVPDYKRVINFSKPDTMTAPVSRATGTPAIRRECRVSFRRTRDRSARRSQPRRPQPVGGRVEHLGDTVGFPEGCGRQQRNGKPARRTRLFRFLLRVSRRPPARATR